MRTDGRAYGGVDRQTDMKLISAFRKSAKGPKTRLFCPKSIL
jgi:hypothetical protein